MLPSTDVNIPVWGGRILIFNCQLSPKLSMTTSGSIDHPVVDLSDAGRRRGTHKSSHLLVSSWRTSNVGWLHAYTITALRWGIPFYAALLIEISAHA